MSKTITIVERTVERAMRLGTGPTVTKTIREFHVDGERACAVPDGLATSDWQEVLGICASVGFDYSKCADRIDHSIRFEADPEVGQMALCYTLCELANSN